MKLRYYDNLDGIRAIAALMVMVFHFFQNNPLGLNYPFLTKVSVFGQTGVTLFFVLSGFVITRILIANKNEKKYFSNFYGRRALRIFPLYYAYLFISYFLFPLIFNTKVPNFSQQIYYYAYLQNFAITFNWNAVGPGHFWSLAVEEHFYFFWPIIVYYINVRQLTYSIFIIIIGSILLRYYMLTHGYDVFYFTFTRFDSIASGALLAIIENKKKISERSRIVFLLIFIVFLVSSILIWTVFTGEGNFMIQIIKFTLIFSIYFSLIGFVISDEKSSFTTKLLSNNILIYIGKISYGLYVFHPFAYHTIDYFFEINNLLLDFVLKITLTIVISSVSFYTIESFFLKFKNRFAY